MAKEDMAIHKLDGIRNLIKTTLKHYGVNPDQVPNRIRTGSHVNELGEVMAKQKFDSLLKYMRMSPVIGGNDRRINRYSSK